MLSRKISSLAIVVMFLFAPIASDDLSAVDPSRIRGDCVLIWSTPSWLASLRPQRATGAIAFAQQPIRVNDTIVCSFPPDQVLAIKAKSGRRVWEGAWRSIDQNDELLKSILDLNPNPQWGLRSLAIEFHKKRDLAYSITVDDRELVAFNATTDGHIEWRAFGRRESNDADSKQAIAPIGPPTTFGDELFCIVKKGSRFLLINIAEQSGKLVEGSQVYLGEAKVDDVLSAYSPVPCGDLLVCPLPTNRLVAIETKLGVLRWSTDTVDGRIGPTQCVSIKKSVFSSTDHACSYVNGANGNVIWSRDDLASVPILVSDRTLVVRTKTEILGIEVDDGEVRWSLSLPAGELISGIGFGDDGELFVPVNSKHVYVYSERSGKLLRSYDATGLLGQIFPIEDGVLSVTPSHISRFRLIGTLPIETAD